MSASDQAAWKQAHINAKSGRPNMLVELIAPLLPDFAREGTTILLRTARFKNKGRDKAKVPTKTQTRQWEGKKLFKRWCSVDAKEEWALEKVKAQDRAKFPGTKPFSDKTWWAVVKDKRDEHIDPERFSKKAFLDH
jgi:hypothetical protein